MPGDARQVLVLGRGVSGEAAAALARARGFSPLVIEGDAAMPDGDFAFAVVSPGVPLCHPWLAACRARALPCISELQFGAEECRRRGIGMLAVTGSKGKSSVVKVVADALCGAGRRAVPCGNYGRAISDVALEDGVEWAVVEVSSFQMEATSLAADAFEAAAILNLQEDHLDRHGTLAAYHALKRRLLAMARRGLAPGDSTGLDLSPLAGSYFDNPVLRRNGEAALWLMLAAGLSREDAARAFRAFAPLPHRMCEVGVFGGVRYVDDSKATSVAALAAGVQMAAARGGAIRLIAGGLAKGDNPKLALPHLTNWVKKVYLIGRSAEAFRSAWSGAVACEVCGTMDLAVERAMGDAAEGETVLLSPGAASFDQFTGFGQRGDVFAALVKKEGQKKK